MSAPGFFTESDGKPSSTRVLAAGAVVAACGLAFIDALGYGDVDFVMVASFLGAGFGGKVWAKYAENKEPSA